MRISYDKEDDALIITLKPDEKGGFEYIYQGFVVTVNEVDELVELTIPAARQFIAQALAAGIEVETSEVKKPKNEMVWYDVDSSMISAFGYNEAEQILDVAFHRTGVYRYYNVPRQEFEGLRDAASKGRYLRACIIDMYPYEKKRGRSRR